MLIGFIAIGGALVYRATRAPAQDATYSAGALPVPEGAEIVSAVASDGLMTLTYRIGPATQIRIFNGESGTMLRQMDVVLGE